ncbi:MAG: hypothetical protein ACOZAN_00210 [Patescibacteria group bacterium]
MTNPFTRKTFPRISQKNLTRFLLMVIVILSLATGYYHTLWQQELKRYRRLEDNYVRVRQMLGREETQRLIDLSKENHQENQQEN